MRITPRCRVCNTKVEYLGDYCEACLLYEEEYDEAGITEIERQDRQAIEARMNEEDY